MSSSYNGTSISDFAHETGHLMGLVDSSGGIMDFSGMTSGRVSQGNIDQAVQNVCGKDACPDRCCCGNAKVDTAKGEGCDPLAAPSGCVTGTSCCPVCCKCQVPSCDPLSGEYPSEEDCKKNCKGERETCHINYHTGCWDCAHQLVIESNREYQSTRETIWKANESTFHPPGPKAANTTQLAALLSSVTDRPVVSDFLANERISVHLKEGEYYITTKDGGITEFGEGPGTDPTVNVWSDEQTLRQIADGNLIFEDAVSSGRVRFEGVGFVSFIKFAVSELLVKVKSALDIGG
jgi:putative sterol carrier protein